MKKYGLFVFLLLFTFSNDLNSEDAEPHIKGRMLNSDFSLTEKDQNKLIVKTSHGDSEAAYKLYLFNYCVTGDKLEGIFWLRTAAGLKHPIAEYNLGLFYMDKYKEFYNLENAKRWFQKAKRDGYESAEKKLKEIEDIEVRPNGDSKKE